MKTRLLAISLILFAGLSAAQTHNATVSPNPGLVKAGGLLHGLDVAVDNAMVAAGFRSVGDVAFERASEMSVAEDRNNSAALEKAAQRFNKAVERADNRDRDRLQQAEQILKNVSSRVPEEAKSGISTALESVEKAKQRNPEEFTTSTDGPRPKLREDVPGSERSGR